MKTLCLPMLLLLCMTSCAQNEEDVIKAIRTHYDVIQKNIKNFDTTTVDVWDESTEGGEATGYFDHKKLQLIDVTLYGERGKAEMSYYFADTQLIFELRTDYRYNRPIYYDEEHAKQDGDSAYDYKKTVVTEERYYYNKGKLIRWLGPDKKPVSKTEKKFMDAEKEEIAFVRRLRKLVRG